MDITQAQYLEQLLKNEKRERQRAEQMNDQHHAHLLASQRIAKVGSWELLADPAVMDVIGDNIRDIYFSDETYNILGLAQGSYIDHNIFFSSVHPDDADRVSRSFFRALATRSIYDEEHRIVLPDGDIKTVRGRAEITDTKNGKLQVKGTLQDISKQKQTDEQLRHANYELRLLFANMQDAFFSVDMIDYMMVQMSPACEKIFGYTREDFFQNRNLWLEMILDEDKPTIYANHARMEKGETIIQEYRIRRKDGDIRWIEARLQPTLDAQGRLVRLDGLNSDITKRKEAELALQRSESKFRFLIENSADGIGVLGPDRKVRYASDSVHRILGYTPEEMIGKCPSEFVLAEDLHEFEQLLQTVLDNPGKACNVVCRRVKKDGTIVWADCIFTNLLHEPAINGIVINFRDVTERKANEDALRTSNEELKKSNRELDRFVYSVSHDLRAPLASMLGIVSLSESDTDDELLLKHFDMLKKSINRLDGFINDILDHSRNARTEVELETINLKELVNDVIQQLKFMDGNSSAVSIITEVPEDLTVHTDRNRLGIVLNNLISNAIRYSDGRKERPFVSIAAKQLPSAVQIEIEDNGIGIEKKKQEKVFDMFYRVSERSIGSGLGLYIVKETVDRLDGRLEMRSEPGEGTCFTLSFPNL